MTRRTTVAARQKTCRCDAYAFPHREYGGKCDGFDSEAGDEEAADRWLSGVMRRPRRNPDHFLDDPRHGQCRNGKFEEGP